MKLSLLALACGALLALPAASLAATCSPPGVSGVSEYSETLPGVNCDHPTSGPGSGGGHGGSLPASTRHRLASLGGAGRAVERLVAATGTRASSGHGARSRGATTVPRATQPASGGTAPSVSGRSPLSTLLHSVSAGSSSGGIGVLLPLILVGLVVLTLGAMLVRRRRLS